MIETMRIENSWYMMYIKYFNLSFLISTEYLLIIYRLCNRIIKILRKESHILFDYCKQGWETLIYDNLYRNQLKFEVIRIDSTKYFCQINTEYLKNFASVYSSED